MEPNVEMSQQSSVQFLRPSHGWTPVARLTVLRFLATWFDTDLKLYPDDSNGGLDSKIEDVRIH